MRYLPLVILLVLSFSLGITLQKAISIAQDELKVQTTPQSQPAIQSRVNGEDYWIVELDSAWVPVRDDGTIIKEYDNSSYEAVKLHYIAKSIYVARSSQDYPYKKSDTFLIMQGNVQTKITFLQTYYPQMPDELKPYVADMISAATELNNTLSSTLTALNNLKGVEGNMLSTRIDEDRYKLWRSKFVSSLSGISDVVAKAYLYDSKKNTFLEVASNFTQRDDVSPEDRQLVKSFMTGVDIVGIPSSLPSLKEFVNNWDNWLNTQLSADAVDVASSNYYENFLDLLIKSDVSRIGLEAYSRINSATQSYSDISYAIGSCLDELGVRSRYENVGEYIDKATADYQAGKEFYDAGDYSSAEAKFNSSLSWIEKAEKDIEALQGLTCSSPGINLSSYVLPLIILLGIGIAVYYFKFRPKQPEEEEGDEYEGYEGYEYY